MVVQRRTTLGKNVFQCAHTPAVADCLQRIEPSRTLGSTHQVQRAGKSLCCRNLQRCQTRPSHRRSGCVGD